MFWFRTFLVVRSASASRKRPFCTGLFFNWILLVLLILSRVDFRVFALFLEAVGVREYCCMYGARNPVGSSVLRAFLGTNACFTRDEPSSKRFGGVGLSRKLPTLRSWRCTQPRAAKGTAGVAVVGKMVSIFYLFIYFLSSGGWGKIKL